MIRNVLSFNELKKFCTGATLTAGSDCFSAESPAEGSPLASGEAPFIGECCVAVNERSVRENCTAGLFAFWAKAVAVVMLCVMAMSGQGWALSQVGGVYQIGSCKDLKDFSDLVNEYTINSISDTACIKSGTPKITATFTHPNLDAKLTKDIDFDADECNRIVMQPIGGNVTYTIHYSEYYKPIIGSSRCNEKTHDTTLANKYSGTFDGNGHTISNLNISSSSQYVGLFGYVDGGTIKNVKVENSTITRTGTGTTYAGVVVGYLKSGTVTGVATENSSVAGSDVYFQNWSSGGIAGYNGGTISECSVVGGTIKGRTEVGGIAGTNAKDATITDCLASPDVLSGSIALETGIGGIAGKNNGDISRVVYTGDRVSNTQNNSRVTGGPITGSGSKDCIELCYYTENVGLQPTGGDAQESDIEKIKEKLGDPWDVAGENLIVVNEVYYYTVTIDPNGRGSQQTISVKKNQKIESLDSIMVGGFKRIGLCKDAGCTQKWNLASDQVTANITLYAKWAQAYTVTFTIGTLADGETGSFPSGATTVKYCVPGEKITADGITSPTFARGVLAGWSRTDDGTVDADLGTMGSEAVTVYAIENISNVVDITYKPGTNGTGSEVTQKAVPGTTVNLKGNLFTRTSYAQDGWSTSNDENTSNSSLKYALNQSIEVPASGLTLYPHWKSTSVKIEYKYSTSSASDSSGNTIAAAYKAEDADFNLTRETFTREGYRQDGWSLKYEGNKSYDMGAPYNVNENTTFYPHWIQVFTVTFNANGRGSAPEAQIVDINAKAAEPAAPSVENYTFNGWNTKQDGTGTTWDFNTNTVTANTTLYAMWAADKFAVIYKYTINGGTDYTIAGDVDSVTVGTTDVEVRPDYMKDGYTMSAWSTEDATVTNGKFTMPAKDVVFTSTGTVAEYDIMYNVNGGTNAASNPAKYTILTNTITLADASREGYTFDGWYDSGEFTNKVTEIAQGSFGDKTLFAKWTIKTHTITYLYSIDGGATYQNAGADPVTVDFGSSQKRRGTYVLDGYEMSAWTVSPDTLTIADDGAFTMPDADVVFKTIGTKKNFTIAYFIGDTQAGDAVSVEFGGTITPKDTSKTGYAFSGWTWYSLADASNPVQLEEPPKAMPAYNLKAVGTFAPIQYTATFDANSGVFAEGAVTSKLVDFDAAITAEGISEPTRTGYVFKGWSRTQTATAADENLGTMNSTEGVTIYAVWVQTFTVTFNKNGHGSDVETQTVESGSNVVKPDDLSETGYTFAGWFADDGTFENAYEFSSAVTADVTLYAKWTANSYTVTYKITGDYFATEEFETSSASFADVVNVTTKSTDKDGYTFSGWSISEGGVTILNDQFTMGTANVVLTGSYTLNSYTITYNGVDGAINPNTATSYTVESENITLQAATKAGYAFAGWYDNAEFSGDAVTQIAKGTTGNKTFYAKWTAIPVVVTIEGNSETKTYNGESQSVNGYTVKSISCDGYTCTDFTADNVALKSGVTAVASGTDASTTPYLMGLNNTSFETKNTAYTNVTFSVTDGSLTINQASDLSVTLERASFTYDGSVHALTAAATTNAKGGTTKIEYQFDGDTEWTEALASLTKVAAGTYTVNVRATNPNYSNIATNSATLEISAATITITAADQWFTYTGSAQQVAVATTDIEGTTITYSVDGGDYGSALPSLTNADTVTVTVKAEKANYTTATKTFSFGVAKAPVTVAAENKEQVYGAEAATLTATVTGKPESGAAVNYTLARGEGANVGTYAINVTLGENPNYEITTTAGTYTITKKAVVVKAIAASKTYGDADPELTATVTGVVEGETASEKIAYTLARAEGEDVGEYEITASGAATQGNYSVSYEPAKFTINQLEATLSWSNVEFDYDGAEHVPTATVSNLVGTDACTVTVTGAASAAGEHTATATALSNTNYKLPASVTQTFNIKAGAFAVTLSDNVTYNGTKQTPTVTVKDGDKTLELDADYTVAWDNDGFTNAGDYKVTVTGKGNYTGSETATYTILKKTATIAVDAASKTYGEIDPTFTGKVEGLVNDADLGTIAYVRTDAATDKDAGTYTNKLTATYTENANYTVTVTPADFTIDQLVATLAWTGTEFDFDGAEHVPTATVSNLVGTDACTVTVTGAASAAGEHTATATALSNTNYKLPASVTQTFNIKAGAFAVTLSENKTYNGTKQTPTVTVKDGTKTLVLDADYTVAWDNDGFTNAGDYKVTVTGKGNYTGSETATYTISKKTATIAVDAASKTYGEIDPTFTGKVEGLVNDADLGTIAYVRMDAATDVNAGTYTNKLTATFTENANYTVSVTPATFTINQLEAMLSWSNVEFDYDGAEHVPTATVSNLVGTDECTVTVTGAASTAGEHTATASALGNANYKLPASTTQTFNIKAGAFAVTLSENKTYNGTKQTPTVTVKDGTKTLVLDADYTVAWDKDGFTNAGDYKVTVTGKGNYTGSETATYTILKKAVTIAVTAAEKTYGAADPTFTGKVEGLVAATDLGTIAYVRTDAATDVNAGTYTNKLTATYTENANYTVSVTPATFTINQLEATLAWSNTEFNFDGAEHVPTATVSNLVGTDACTVTVTGAASAAGEHTATATALSNTNYKLPASVTQTFNIKAGAFAVTLSENKTYNGTKQTPTVTVKDGGKMLELGTDYTVAWDNDGFTNAGDYKVTVTGKGNYTGSETATYTILKKTATIAVDAASKTFGETDPTFTATVAGTVGEDNVVYTLTRVEGENVGTYTITASGDASQGNYSVTYETATFTIAKATVNTVTVAIDGWTFGESAKIPTASATFKADGEPVVTYAVKGGSDWSATAPTAAGEYTVKATVAETDNYVGGSATKDFTIAKAGFTVAGTNYEDVYDGASHGAAATPSVTEGTTVSYSTDNGTTWSTTAPTIKDVGEISVSVKAENANYETATTTYTLKVTKRAITLTSASDRKFYDGTALTASTVIVSEGSYANGESFQYNVTGSQIEVGASENTFTYSATSSAKVENYEVTLVTGKLTVDPVVTFVMNGHGTQVAKQEVLTGEKATEPTEPSAEGYTFGGWFTDNETFANAYDFNAAVNENKTLYAKWTVNRYTVTWWKSEEKRQAHDQKTDVPFDSVITAPTKDAPTKQGYLFDKWTSTDVTVAEDGSFTMPAKAVDLVPAWKLETYSITYELNGGTNAVSNPATYNFETETFNFADPTRDGFVFLGWYGESDFSGEKITGVEKGSVGDMKLYAYWANDAYTITYNPGEYGEGGLAAGKKVYGKPFTLSADDKFTRVGYTQTGWTTTDGGSQVYAFGDSYTTDADITLYPVWRINTHSVTFMVGEKIIRYDGEVTYGKEVTAPTAPDSLGYTFAQWQSDNEGISSLGVNGKFNMIDEDVVAKALYWVDTYKLTYDLGDGTCGTCSELTGYNVTQNVTLPTDVEKTGYTFAGWYDNDKFEGSAVTEIAKGSTGDKKFYAKWTINNYTITYKITGDYFKNDAFVTGSADFGTVVDTTTTSTVQEGYTFSGWSVAEGGVTLENGKFTMGTANVVLTGSYSINSYDVVWKKDDATYSSSSVAYGVEVVAPATAPTKNGYDFAGWTTSDVTLADDYSFTMPAKAVTLNADWNLVTYEIAYETNGGEAVPSSNYTIESADITLPTTTRLGYDFGGWFNNEDLSGTAVTKVAAGSFGNKKFYAKWDVVTYNITYTGLGDMTHENPVTYTVEDAVVLTDPTDSTGYSFDGWYIGEDKVTSIAKGSTGAKTIVAKWSPKNVEFKVVYELYGATGSKEKTMDEVTLEGPADAPIIDYITWKDFGDGYDYELVYINDVEHNKSYFTDKIARDGSTVVKVRVEHNEFTFTFYTEGESGWKKWDEQPLYYGYDDVENNKVKAPTAPTKTGYTFVGWCADAETCESVQTFPMNVPAKNMKFYAKWTINPYTITFDTKGGSTVVAITQDYNTAVTAPENPTRTGYLFAGWDKEIPATMPAEDITITAKWDMDVKASGYTGVYDGDAHGIVVTAPEGATVTYSTAEDGDYVATLTYVDVGTYTVYYKASQEGYADVKGSATVAITPATMTLVVAGYTDTYDGAAHSGTATPSVTEGTTVSYSTDNGTTWSTTAPIIKDVGEISVSVKAENANYETATNSYTLKVTPKAVVVKATAAQKTYGETDPEFTGKVEGLVAETDLGEITYFREGSDVNVGTYTDVLTAAYTPNNNYNVTIAKGVFTIGKRSVTFTGEDDTREYTGSEIELTNVTVGDDGLLSGHTHNVTYSAKGIEVGKYNGVITNAADVKIMAGETDVTSNYDIATYAMALDIKPAGKFTIALANDTTTYDGAPHNNVKTAVSEAVSGTTTFQYQFEGDGETWVSNLEDLVKVNAGEYIINVKATNTNYADMATTTAKLTIIPKTATVSAVDAGKTLGSKDPELLATITGVVGEDKLEYVVARDEGENVGYYQIAPVGAENQGNYRVAYEPARFTISPVVKVVLAKGMELICTESECDADGNIKYTYGKETMLPAAKVSDDESWIFQGLFENEKLAGTPVTKISADVTKNVTLYPNFTKNIIAKTDSGIVFIAKDMDDTQDSLNRKVTVAARVAFPLPRKSSDGLYSYRFTEYAYNAETDVYEAQFVGVPQKFLVTFNLPEGAVLSTEIETYTYGETTKLPTASIKGAEDWEFKGWYTKPDGNGTRVKAISAGEFGEKTLYPLFQKTIAYDANGARGEVSAIYAENAEMVINAALADVVPQDYVKKGKTYTFDKWVLENGTYVAKFTQTDALKAASVPHFTVSVMNRVLEISGARMGAKVAVFDMRGTLVASGIVENGTQRVEIAQPGSYIVRVNNQATRVNIR